MAWRRAPAAAAAVLLLLALALLAVTPQTTVAQPPSLPIPVVLLLIADTINSLSDNPALEAPFEFRLNAATALPTFDCVGIYAPNARRYRAWDGTAVRRAPPALRSDDAIGLCAAAAIGVVDAHLFGAAAVESLYAATAAGGFDVPRGNDSRCGAAVPRSAIGCTGVAVGRRYIAAQLERDGMNADGRVGVPPGGRPRPFFDAVTGYAPVNGPAAGVTRLTRWMPLVEDVRGAGTYAVQSVTAAQTSRAKPVLVPARRLRRLRVPPPYKSPDAYAPDFVCGGRHRDPDGLCAKARAVLDAGRHLTDRRRTLITWFDRKASSIAALPLRLLERQLPFADYLALEFALGAFSWDATVAVWGEKLRHDAVRPASLIPSILRRTRAGAAWAPAIRTMPHAEYPSASAAICSGFALLFRTAGGDALNLTVPFAAGAVGDGLPAAPFVERFADAAAIATACADSRVWGGLHFPDAVDAGQKLGEAVAKEVLAVVACRAPGTPWLPPCERRGGGGGGKVVGAHGVKHGDCGNDDCGESDAEA